MDSDVSQLLNLAVRWFHVVVGVLWIGQTALFSWLDARLRVEAEPGGKEQVWMVHSGGFYVVDRQRVPEILPRTLHWFRWEAAWSWISGMLLLVLVYYHGGALVDPVEPESGLSPWAATAVALAVLAVGWLVYDGLWLSPLAQRERLAEALSVLLIALAAWGFSQFLSGRAAYIHVGALFGTVMAANVWQRILPAQRQMVEAVKQGQPPDPRLGLGAKQRSRHNTFLAVPLLFIMVSNHFPTVAYGHRVAWGLLLVYVAVGFAARALINTWNERRA